MKDPVLAALAKAIQTALIEESGSCAVADSDTRTTLTATIPNGIEMSLTIAHLNPPDTVAALTDPPAA